MASYGRQQLDSPGGLPIQVSADGNPDWIPIGITLDWDTIDAVSGSDETYTDGTVVKVGQKGLPLGTILCEITQAEVQTVDLSGADDPTGGTFTITVPNYGTTDALAYNVSAADVQAALEELVGAGNVTVGKSGFVYTLTFTAALGNVSAVTVASGSLTSGGTVTVTIGTSTEGSGSAGKYGPYDGDATDGRQTLSRGKCCILNATIVEPSADSGLGVVTEHPGCIEGGLVWKARLKVGSTGQPAWNDFEAAFPRVRYVEA
jgi:hypothetical protein